MIIKFNGEISLEQLPKMVEMVVNNIIEKADLKYKNYTIKDAELGIVFDVEGEKRFLTVEHDGIVETFKTIVELGEDGDVKRSKDNEEESFLDDYSRAIAKGEPSPTTKEIESVFNDEDLEFLSSESGGDLVAYIYRHLKEEGLFVMRYFRNNILVGETGYKKREA